MSKIKIGIIFGGRSKEREISFAGGRTVYDNLNKSLFEAVPIFVDSWGNFTLLNWEYIYKGTIRDFYPPVEYLPKSSDFQYYAENLGNIEKSKQLEMISKIGKPLRVEELQEIMDFAFLCLHGPYGEDGKIQGLMEYLEIPYSGSGILASSIGIDKSVQKTLMVKHGFNSPNFFTIERKAFTGNNFDSFFKKAENEIGYPLVIKPANQGSSIGVTILSDEQKNNEERKCSFISSVEKAFFIKWIEAKNWNEKKLSEKKEFIRQICDIREGIGLPAIADKKIIYSPDELLSFLNEYFEKQNEICLESLDGESTVLIEGFISGKEFSCIVVEDEYGIAISLPPTEIRKGKELFDYRSKYLPGLSRKITPIDLPSVKINAIRSECEKLFYDLKFDVYARIDGFISNEGKIFLNDPNTTSGMMPSSFFFHQAAEIGLNPSQFLTFIISTSLNKRNQQSKNSGRYSKLIENLENGIINDRNKSTTKTKVAVLLGGYSSERHISVESGRNIYEKLSSSEKYEAIPVFLTGNNDYHELYQLPINVLLKDNADDILEKATNYQTHEVVAEIKKLCASITGKFASSSSIDKPIKLNYSELSKKVEQVFIALHGRPGEDGSVQEKLEEFGLSYNGSDKSSSCITIDKYRTNELLSANGLMVAKHFLISKDEWISEKNNIIEKIRNDIGIPFIAKPVDDGCSSAVKKIKSIEELEAFAQLIFRDSNELLADAANILNIKPKEEFPIKKVILIEELISKKDAKHFLEITGGMITKFNDAGEVDYEVFEASEALSEGDVLSLEEKFLAGQGQNITPARYSVDKKERQVLSNQVKVELEKAARVLNVTGYCRIDAFVRVYEGPRAEVIFIEVNSLPGMTPATCIFHQAAINAYKPYEFIDGILHFGNEKKLTALKR
ncbi:MAG: D-alanine--D-alanine ligase [Bacteroidota bacterium]|jgi:UDP-N-acetylmuramate--alanine ligase